MNNTKKPKLIIIDCDGVLYNPAELNVNAVLAAFNTACDELNLGDERLAIDKNLNCKKPIGGIYNHIVSVAQRANITPNAVIKKTVRHIDYSHITPDNDNILDLFHKISRKYNVCICTNNNKAHLNMVLKAKFGIRANQLPFEVFDAAFAKQGGKYHPKQSVVFINKLEKHFGINACDFLWIDDDPMVKSDTAVFGSQSILITKRRHLKSVLSNLLR